MREFLDDLFARKGFWWFIFAWNAFFCGVNAAFGLIGPSFFSVVAAMIQGVIAWYSWSVLHDPRMTWVTSKE